MKERYWRFLQKFDEYIHAAQCIQPKVRVCTLGREIQLFCGIEAMAQALGKPLTLEKKDSGQFPYKKSFVERGIKVYQLYTEEEIEHEIDIQTRRASDISSTGKTVQLELVVEGVCGVSQDGEASRKMGGIKKESLYRDQAVQTLKGKTKCP